MPRRPSRPTPMQSIVGVGRRLTVLPANQFVEFVNRSVEATTRLGRRTVEDHLDQRRPLASVDRGGRRHLHGRPRCGVEAVRASCRRPGVPATRRETSTAVRRNLGAVDGDELPIRNYDSLTADDAISRIGRLRDADDVRTVLAYETANKHRKGVTGSPSGAPADPRRRLGGRLLTVAGRRPAHRPVSAQSGTVDAEHREWRSRDLRRAGRQRVAVLPGWNNVWPSARSVAAAVALDVHANTCPVRAHQAWRTPVGPDPDRGCAGSTGATASCSR